MLFIRTNTTKNGRRAQGILHPCRCWEPWVGHHHAGHQSAGNPSIESATAFLSSELPQNFLGRRQLCALFLPSNRKDINAKTSFCTVGAATKWELPGFWVRTSWLCLPSFQGVRAAPHSLETTLHTRPRHVCGSPTPPHATVPCTVTWLPKLKSTVCSSGKLFHSSFILLMERNLPASRLNVFLCLVFLSLLWYFGIHIVVHFKIFCVSFADKQLIHTHSQPGVLVGFSFGLVWFGFFHCKNQDSVFSFIIFCLHYLFFSLGHFPHINSLWADDSSRKHVLDRVPPVLWPLTIPF